MQINDITGFVIEAAIKIHTDVGPGCFEKVYEEILFYELIKYGLKCKRQLLMPISYENLFIKNAYKLDLLVEDKLIVEIKCVECLSPLHFKQMMTYLKLSKLKNGMILNFNTNLIKEGIHRFINNFGT